MTRLSFAIPSKGRLKENTETWLSRCGFRLRKIGGGRGYTATLEGVPEIDILLLSAREIAEGLIAGKLHLGVTGEDLLNDLSSNIQTDIHVLRKLGFGHADMVVAVPAAWLDVDTMADLEAAGAQFRGRYGRRLRVATKYMNATRRFFAARSVGEYRLVESAGATEAAPAAGSADLIVDITSTGATLKANGLKILSDGVILRSQAALTASQNADWSQAAKMALGTLLDAIEAQRAAAEIKKIETATDLPDAAIKQPGVVRLGPRSILVPDHSVSEAARALARDGHDPVVITTVEHWFQKRNLVLENFLSKLS
jgi:ATP phosphoribosyltransferase